MTNYFLKAYKEINILNCKIKGTFSILLFKELSYSPLIVSILINLFLFLILSLITTPVYRSNDDIILNLTSAGFFGKDNSEFLLFGNIMLGKLLKLFYELSPQYNWYLIFLFFTQFLSHVVILYYLLRASRKFLTLFLYINLFLIFSVNLVTEINFSGSSLVALAATLLIIISILSKNATTILDYSILFLLFIISVLIRKDTFYIYCYLFFLFPIIYLNKWKSILLIFSISVISFISIYAYNDSYYNKKDPLQLEYRKAGRLMLDGIVKPSIPELTKNGWDKEDYDLYSSFKGIDNMFFSKKSVVRLSGQISYQIDYKKILLSPYSLVLYVINDIYYYSAGLILILILFSLMQRKLRFLFLLFSIWTLMFFVLGIIVIHYRLYVYYAILFYLGITGIYYVLQRSNLKMALTCLKDKINLFAVILLILVSISLTNIVHNKLSNRNSRYSEYDNKVIELKDSGKKFLIVGEEFDYFLGKWSIFKTIKNNSDYRLIEQIIPLGWFINTIQFDNIINGSVIQLLIQGDIFFLGNDDQLFDHLEEFIFKHYSLKVRFEELPEFKYSGIYRLQSNNIK